MKFIPKLLLFSASILVTLNANAQRYWDYVITVKGDSIPCKVDYAFLGGPWQYKTNTMSKPKAINTDEIHQVYVAEGNKLYEPVYNDDKKRSEYLIILEKGKICLYELIYILYTQNNGQSEVTEWYIGKGADHVQYLKGSGIDLGRGKRKMDLAEMLKDDKNVYDKFLADDSFSFDEIRNIVHLYNTGEQYKELGPVDRLVRDYIITPKNDTVYGRVKNEFFKGYFTFREKNRNDVVKIDSSIAKEYFDSREKDPFILKALPGENTKEFVKWLKKGHINLYELAKKTVKGNKESVRYYWYVSKENDALALIKSDAKPDDDIRSHRDFLKTFTAMISDNKEILAQFKEATNDSENNSYFNSDEVVLRYVNNYNYEYYKKQTADKKTN